MAIAGAVALSTHGPVPAAVASVLSCLVLYQLVARLAEADVATWSGIAWATMFAGVAGAWWAPAAPWITLHTLLVVALFITCVWREPSQPTPIDPAPDGSERALRNVACRPIRWYHAMILAGACASIGVVHGMAAAASPVAIIAVTLGLTRHRSTRNHTTMLVAGGLAIAACALGDGQAQSAAPSQADPRGWSRVGATVVALGVGVLAAFPWSCLVLPAARGLWRWRLGSEGWHPLPALVAASVIAGAARLAAAPLAPDSWASASACLALVSPMFGYYIARVIRGHVEDPRLLTASLAGGICAGAGLWVMAGGVHSAPQAMLRPLAFGGVALAVGGTIAAAYATRAARGMAMRAFVVGAIAVTGMATRCEPRVLAPAKPLVSTTATRRDSLTEATVPVIRLGERADRDASPISR